MNYREWRIAQGLTQDALAERLGVTAQTVRRVEAGKPSMRVIRMTAKRFGLPPEEVYEMMTERQKG